MFVNKTCRIHSSVNAGILIDLNMKQKRIRIDVQDKDGAKYDFKIEGNVTKEKVLKIFELMDLINIEEDQAPNLDSVGGKIWNVAENSFPTGRFTSSEVLEKYEDEYNEPIKLSVVSTYLARFASRNRVERTRTGREWSYQIIRIAQKHS